jgi:D-tagatose-1,6-bisphosphate aldolase subunit GatZ/KbaZ
MSLRFDKSKIRVYSEELGWPITELILHTFRDLSVKSGIKRTLLAVCPNSDAVLKAALISAQQANAPVALAATLNQVDLDGGYTGWTQRDFVERVARYVESLGVTVPIIISLDHGGPWLKDAHSKEQWSLERTMDAVKESLNSCIDAGYDMLHIDPTVDKTLGSRETIRIETVIDRTVELMRHSEKYRRSVGSGEVSYEVGTEEVHGGIADIPTFTKFLAELRKGLKTAGLSDTWPAFVVGKMGTDLHTTKFDPVSASRLVRIASDYELFVKGHYTDHVSNPEKYPKNGVGGANVGPEFTDEEYQALLELVDTEERLFREGKIEETSRLDDVLKERVVKGGRWKKWRQPNEMGRSFNELSDQRQRWLIGTGCRYIWSDPQVVRARLTLYRNLQRNGYGADEVVISRISKAIMKYFYAFNLVDSANLIESCLSI